jgi:hypothetical protein
LRDLQDKGFHTLSSWEGYLSAGEDRSAVVIIELASDVPAVAIRTWLQSRGD